MSTNIQRLIYITAGVQGVTADELLKPNRKKEMAFGRHAIVYLAYKHYPPFKTQALAPHMNRDRSTLWHSLGTAKDLMAFNDEFKTLVSQIEKFL